MFRKVILFLSPISIFACGPTISGEGLILLISIPIAGFILLPWFLIILSKSIKTYTVTKQKRSLLSAITVLGISTAYLSIFWS